MRAAAIHPVPDAPTTRRLPFGSLADRLTHRARASTCFVLLTHRIDDFIVARYHALLHALGDQNDVFLVMTQPLPPGNLPVRPEAIVVLAAAEIFFDDLKNKWHPGKIVPGNTDLVMLAFARRFPLYRYYWLIENDVFFPGGPGPLQALDSASSSDLIAMFVSERTVGSRWMWWASLEQGALVEAAGAAVPLPARHVMGLFCISRFSRALLALLEWSYRRGWSGHHEATVPSIAASNGLSIADLGALAVRTLGHPMYEHGGFNVTASKPHFVCGAFAYHPVKTAAVAEELLRQISGAETAAQMVAEPAA